MLKDKDFLEQTKQAGAQIRALGFQPDVLRAACHALLLENDGVECPELISCIAPSVLSEMSTPLTVDECAYALSELAEKSGALLLLFTEDKELAPLVAAKALTKMKQVVEESGVTA